MKVQSGNVLPSFPIKVFFPTFLHTFYGTDVSIVKQGRRQEEKVPVKCKYFNPLFSFELHLGELLVVLQEGMFETLFCNLMKMYVKTTS